MGKGKEIWEAATKFYPIDMDDGVDARHGGLGLRQLGAAVTHCKLEPLVASFMMILCSREIYRYAMVEMGLDSPDLPTGIVSNFHLQKFEEVLLEFIEKFKSNKGGLKPTEVWGKLDRFQPAMVYSPLLDLLSSGIFKNYQIMVQRHWRLFSITYFRRHDWCHCWWSTLWPI